MRALVVGAGAVGTRAARQLLSSPEVSEVLVADQEASAARSAVEVLGAPARQAFLGGSLLDGVAVVVLAVAGDGGALAARALGRGAHVVSVAEGAREATALLALDDSARQHGLTVVAGAGFSPGLTCVLARHGSAWLDTVEALHLARIGTGGLDCARQSVELAGPALKYRRTAPRGDGSAPVRCWFPDPVGARSCRPASAPEGVLLAPVFPEAEVRVAVGAFLPDRITALSGLRRRRTEGTLGALRVELRGREPSGQTTVVLGAVERPAVAAGTVAAVAAVWAATGRLARPGAGGLAELVEEPVAFLAELAHRGVRAATFVPA